MNSQRLKVIAAAVGAGAAITGATVAVGVAGADTEDLQPLNSPQTSVTESVDAPTGAPEAGPSIDAVSTTETTTEVPTP